MEDTTLVVDTKIPVTEVVNKTINMRPHSKCEFDNMMVYAFVEILFKKLNQQMNIQYGGNKRTRRTRRKHKKTRKQKTTKQRGGTNPMIVILFMTILISFVNGMRGVSDNSVIKRIKETLDVADLFKNYYGTCGVNSLLFLKSINLETFENLSVKIMMDSQEKGKEVGISTREATKYLSKNLLAITEWHRFNYHDKQINLRGNPGQMFIDDTMGVLTDLRRNYGSESIISVMIYKSKVERHAVIIWLTSNNDLVIIDPQLFFAEDIVLYTTGNIKSGYILGDEELKARPMNEYINKYMDLTNATHSSVLTFIGMHTELENEENTLSVYNPQIKNVVARIKGLDDSIQDKLAAERQKQGNQDNYGYLG